MEQPAINDHPYANHSYMTILFKTLRVDDIIAIFTQVLMERSVLFYCLIVPGFVNK